MNFDGIETRLLADLKRTLGRGASVIAGPAVTPVLGGMEPTVFVHAGRFIDNGGVTADGARVTRRPVREGRRSGIAEERPGRICVDVTCVATAYKTVKDLSTLIAPRSLLSLTVAREFPVGQLANGSVKIAFADFAPSIALSESFVKEETDFRYHAQRLVFQLDGFLHTWVTASGGLRPAARQPTEQRPKPKKKTKNRATGGAH